MTAVSEKHPKIIGPFHVARRIPLGPVPLEKLQEAVRLLNAMEPVFNAEAGPQNNLNISYDTSCIGIRDIETVLDAADIVRAPGYWWKLKSMWYGYLDENSKANAHAGGGACCNRPPSAFSRRTKHN